MQPASPLIEVALGVVHNEHDELLLVHRARPTPGTHGLVTWAFPGGKVMPQETPEDAAAREVREETGWTCLVFHQIVVRPHPRFGVRLHIYAARALAQVASPAPLSEILEVRWVPRAQVPDFLTQDFDPEVAEFLGVRRRLRPLWRRLLAP